MLNSIRKQAGSWVIKALLMLLVASFAVWGIGDIFYGGGGNPVVATVGDSDIHANELTAEFNQVVNGVQRRLGTVLERDQAVGLGLMQQALQNLIARRLVDLRARDMGLTVADDTLRELIVDNPMFQTAGRFDRSRFEQLLRASGLSEEGYLAGLRRDLVRGTLTGSVTGPVAAPPVLVEALYRHRNEERRGRLLEVTTAAVTDLPEPSEEELEAYHAAHQQEFGAPEYRGLTFVTLEPADVLDEVEVAEDEIRAAYEAQQARFRAPERRTVEQLLASEEDVIERAAGMIAEGRSFGEVEAALAADGLALSQLGEVTEGELPAELSEPIFALAEGEASEPVESPFGWHLLRVSAIEPERVTPFEDAREELRRELALEEAGNRLPAFANALDDELAAGLPLDEAAANVGMEATTLPAVDNLGLDPEGERPAGLPTWPEFLEEAFAIPAGETTLLEEAGEGGYFVLRVDAITPPRTRPLEEVRDEVVAGWQAEQRQQRARAQAEQLLARLNEGVALERVAADAGLELRPVVPLKRSDERPAEGANAAVVRALFATAPGEFAAEVVPARAGFVIVATDEVVGANPADAPEAMARLEAEIAADMRSDVMAQFGAALRRDYPIEIHEAELARLSTVDGLAPARGPLAPPTGFF